MSSSLIVGLVVVVVGGVLTHKLSSTQPGAEERGQPAPRKGRYASRTRPQLQRRHIHRSPRDTRAPLIGTNSDEPRY
jgi:hypothetical protein